MPTDPISNLNASSDHSSVAFAPLGLGMTAQPASPQTPALTTPHLGSAETSPRVSALADDNFIEDTSSTILGAMSDIGGWWKGVKQRGSEQLTAVTTSTAIATAPEGAYGSYLEGAAIKIALNDKVGLKEGMKRVPQALDQSSSFSKTLGKFGAFVDATTGALDVMEALHDEGGKPGSQTMRMTAKTLAQVTLAGAAGKAIFVGVAGLGLGITGAPLMLGAIAAAGASYGIGKALDWWAGGK